MEVKNSTQGFLTQQKIVCVSGVTGFLGQAIVLKLNELGYSILALSRGPVVNRLTNVTSSIDYVSGTIDEWEQAIRQFRPNVIISCDWEGVSQEQRKDPKQDLNCERVARLGKLAVEVNAETFLTFGSQAEVAPSENLIHESTQEDAQNFYGLAKIKLHKALNFIASNSITRIIWVRIFTIYGPGDIRKSIVTEGIRKAIAGEDFIIQHPHRKWSFLYIDDFTNAILKILENEVLTGVVNIGNPVATDLGLISEIIFKSLNLEHEQYIPAQNADLDSALAWIPKTETLSSLGWQPETTIHGGISKTIEWWRLKE